MTKGTYKQLLQTLLVLGIVISFSRSAEAARKAVWQIGNFDQSPLEFNTGKEGPPLFGSRYPAGELLYIVGKSNPAVDWPAYQGASTVSKTGSHSHPYTIQFDLPEAPAGVYTLKVGLLAESARVGRLQVEINGHRGLFYQHPKLDYSGGDGSMIISPNASADTIAFDFPANFLQKGTNKLVLTAIDEPAGTDDEASFIAYDALELGQDSAKKYSAQEVTAEVEPTVFYLRHGDGLAELVDVYVRHNAAVHHGEVTLAVGQQKFSHELSERDFGEQMAEFPVPEFTSAAKAEVTVKLNGHARHFPVVLTPAKKWTLFVVPHVHLDIGYTDYQEKVAEIQSREIDEAMGFIREHPDFRYSLDGFWSVREFLAGRSEEQQKQLLQMVKEKKVFVPTVEASLLTGFPTLETLIRSLYPAYEFNRRYGGDPNYADITDVPSYTWSYASITAAAGLKYFVAGCDSGNGPILLYSRLNEKSPFWWEGPDGGKILMWYSRMYFQLATLFGGLEPHIAAGHDSIPIFLQAYSHPEYKSDAVLVYGTQWENTDLVASQATLADDWNKTYAYPHMQYSGFAEGMGYIARQFGDAIPVVRGDGGPYWEDGIASTARSAALEREVEQRAPAAETFSTIGSLINPLLRPQPEVLRRLWHNMVSYDEHTWGADRSVSDPKSQEAVNQLAYKVAFATEAKRDLDYLLRRGLAGVADYIYDPKDTLVVFNPLSWKRSGIVEVDMDKGRELLDLASNRTVPYEVLSTGKSYRHIRVLAQDVPSVGYKAFAMRLAKAEPPAPQATSEGTFENQYYRVTLDPGSGSVKSIFDKELNKELVNSSSPYRFDQYLYVTGGDQRPNGLGNFRPVYSAPELFLHNPDGGRLLSVTKQPFGVVARLASSAVNTPRIETEVILFDGQKKIEFINRVQKTEVYTREGVYFAFPFALEHPQFRYEIQNGFVDLSRDQLPGAGKEWFSVQHWVAAEQDGVTAALVPVDASLVTLGDINRGKWPREFGQRPGTIFSYVMNNYWGGNYAASQGGDFTFRYVLTSGHNLQPAYLSRLGREEMSPLEVNEIIFRDKWVNPPEPLNSAQGSFLRVSQPEVVLVTWKRAEDGEGTILRFLETAGQASTVNVEFPLLKVESAFACNALEQNQQPLSVSPHGFGFSVKPFQIVTVRVNGVAALPSTLSQPQNANLTDHVKGETR